MDVDFLRPGVRLAYSQSGDAVGAIPVGSRLERSPLPGCVFSAWPMRELYACFMPSAFVMALIISARFPSLTSASNMMKRTWFFAPPFDAGA